MGFKNQASTEQQKSISMKKWFTVIAATVLAFGLLVGCSGETDPVESEPGLDAPLDPAPGDESFNPVDPADSDSDFDQNEDDDDSSAFDEDDADASTDETDEDDTDDNNN